MVTAHSAAAAEQWAEDGIVGYIVVPCMLWCNEDSSTGPPQTV